MFIGNLRLIAYLALCSLLTPLLLASSPSLAKSYPTGGQQGSDLKITCIGNRLKGAKSLLFYKSGITTGKPEVVDDKKVIFPIKIASGAAFGEYLFRVHCDDGLSELRSFWVGPYPSIVEKKESNNSIKEAQEIHINHTIEGVSKNEDQDFYKIKLKKDQLLSLELEGMRLGRVFYDPFISILDSSNRELISSDDAIGTGQDPKLAFKAPHEGDFYILVRESSYQGNNEARYRLHLGDFAQIRSIYPLGAEKNKELHFRIETELHDVHTHKAVFKESNDSTPVHYKPSNKITLAPNFIRVADYGFIQEKEPNNDAKHKSQPFIPHLPIGFHGTIDKADDVDYFRFHGKKGQKIRAQVYADALGSPIDTAISFKHPDGKFISYNDDAFPGSSDSKLNYTIPVDGIYWLTVRDHLKRFSPHHHYRIELTTVTPELTASLVHKRIQETQKWKAFVIPQKNKSAYEINIGRNGVKGELNIIAKSLPKGVTMRKVTQNKNNSKALIYLESSPTAPITAGLHPFILKSKDGKHSAPITAEVHPFLGGNNKIYHTFKTKKTAIAVVKQVPVTIELVQPTQPIVQSGTMSIKVRAHRKKGYDKEITVEVPWKPAGISANYSLKIPKGKSEATLNIGADGNCPVGKWDFIVRALFSDNGNVEICSNIIKLEVKPPYLTAKLEMAATTQGVSTNMLCKLTHLTPFEGKAKLTLHGLPDGIVAKPVEITKASKELAIPITVPANARIGKHGNLFCRVNIPQAKLSIPHTIGQGGTLRVNPPAKKKVTKKTDPKDKPAKPPEKKKKPLSRLEELRRK